MSYLSQSLLVTDTGFVGRSRACLSQQADTFKDDERLDLAALAFGILRQDTGPLVTFQVLLPATPGFADTAGDADGFDSSRITDPEILAGVQSHWPTVARIYYNPDGSPIPAPLPQSE